MGHHSWISFNKITCLINRSTTHTIRHPLHCLPILIHLILITTVLLLLQVNPFLLNLPFIINFAILDLTQFQLNLNAIHHQHFIVIRPYIHHLLLLIRPDVPQLPLTLTLHIAVHAPIWHLHQ